MWRERTLVKVSFAEKVCIRPIPCVGKQRSCRGDGGAEFRIRWREEKEDRELDQAARGVRGKECASLQRRDHDPRGWRAHRCEERGEAQPRGEGPGVNSLDDDRGVYSAGGSDYVFESDVQYSGLSVCVPGSVAPACVLPVRSDSCSTGHLVPTKVVMAQPAIRRVSLGDRAVPIDVIRAFWLSACEWQFESVGRHEVEPRVEGGAFSIRHLLSPMVPPHMHMYSAKQMHTDIPRLVASRLKCAETQVTVQAQRVDTFTPPYPYHSIVVAERLVQRPSNPKPDR